MSVSWSRDRGSLSPYAIIRKGSLRIDRVAATDAGTYTCRADSQAGNSIASATLTVRCKYKTSIIFIFCYSGFF